MASDDYEVNSPESEQELRRLPQARELQSMISHPRMRKR